MNLLNKHAPAILFVSALLAQNVLSAGAQPAGTPTGKLVQAIKNGSLRRSIVGAVAALAATPFREHAPDEASTTYEPSTNQNNGVDSEEADEGEHYSNQSGPNNLSVPITEQQQGLNQKLITAIKRGNVGDVKHWNEKGAEVNAVDENGIPALHLATIGNDEPIVKYLLSLGAVVQALDGDGQNAYFYACFFGYQKVIDILSEYLKVSAVHTTQPVNRGHSAVPTYLSRSARSRPSDFDDSEEEDQALRGQNRRLNTNVMSSIEITHAVHMQRTIEFLLAACHGQLEELKRLLSQGVDINVVDNQGATALYLAAYFGHLEVVQHLLLKKADIKAVDHQGCTALHIAAFYGHLEVVQHLLLKKADIKAVDHQGFTALHIAANRGHTEVVKLLQPDDKN